MAVQTGRTVDRWTRVLIDDNAGTPREIPVDTMSPVGFVYDSEDLTAWQDAVKGYLAKHPDASIEFGGPWDTTAAAAAAASAAAPVLSGSHTVLNPLTAATFTTPLGFAVCYGVRHYWEAGEPVFGVVSPSATAGYTVYEYRKNGPKYTCAIKPFPGTTPAWGTAILT